MMTNVTAEPETRVPVSRPACMDDLLSISVLALGQMYDKDEGAFAFCIRRGPSGDSLEGVSRRYTAISLIGLAAAIHDRHGSEGRRLLTDDVSADEQTPLDLLGGENLADVCGRLLNDVHLVENVGDVALTLWAARAIRHDQAEKARERLLEMTPWERECPTVELAWVVTALCHDPDTPYEDSTPLERVARRLLKSFVPSSSLFPHWPIGARPAPLRGHVCCFADLVYPTQALAIYHKRTGDDEAATIAKQCGRKMCALQGPAGQWWWHFDARTGSVVERYPVYAVHQDSMAPMALLDLQEACGVDHGDAIEKGLQWLEHPVERSGSLIDAGKGVIWRKVARREPNKLSRSANALLSCIHPSLRAWGLGALLRPGWVDWESRPYHFGWVLYAWCNRRFQAPQLA